eukprot:s2507_g14.t1
MATFRFAFSLAPFSSFVRCSAANRSNDVDTAEFGIDASKLPRELLDACEDQAMNLLVPDQTGKISGAYQGPIPLVREAFKNTRSLGSTTVCLALRLEGMVPFLLEFGKGK